MSSPSQVLLKISSDCSITGISNSAKNILNNYDIWAIYFDLRHGLGLIIFKQIIEAHGGTVDTPEVSTGYKTILSF